MNPENIIHAIQSINEALTPSAETKAAYIGEFKFKEEMGVTEDDEPYVHEFTVPWTTVKEIMKAVIDRAIEQNEDRI